jgi:hypothetical protein
MEIPLVSHEKKVIDLMQENGALKHEIASMRLAYDCLYRSVIEVIELTDALAKKSTIVFATKIHQTLEDAICASEIWFGVSDEPEADIEPINCQICGRLFSPADSVGNCCQKCLPV